MRRILLPLVLLAAGIAAAAWVAPYTYKYEMATCPTGAQAGMCLGAQACSGNSCTGTDPSGMGEGMTLYGLVSYRLTICAASGQTLAGAGTLKAWRYDSAEALWVRNRGLDQSANESTKQCQVFPDFLLAGGQAGRVRFVSSGVTVSGGSTLDVLLDGYSALN